MSEQTELEAVERLRMVQQAQAATEKHSVNNGVIPLGWGLVIALGLPLFDLFPGIWAALGWGIIALLASAWTALYGATRPVYPRKVHTPFIWWGFYYALVLVGGILLFPSKPPFLFTGIGLVAAAPLLIIGWRKWSSFRRQ